MINIAVKTVTVYLNGTWHTLTYNANTGDYEKVVTAPTLSSNKQAGGYYAMQIKAEDTAGNITTIDSNHETYGSALRLVVKEKVAPVITITSPGSSAYLTSHTVTLQFDVTDNDSGVNPSTISLQIDSLAVVTSGITKTAITGGYRCVYTATLVDGPHSIKVNATDYDGNSAVQKVVSFVVDTVPPTLNISTPAADLITNKQACDVTGTTNDATSAPCTIMIKLNNADQGAVVVNADGSFSKQINFAKGVNTIYVKSTDKAGKDSDITRTVIFDPDAPVVISVIASKNPVNAGDTFMISVKATD